MRARRGKRKAKNPIELSRLDKGFRFSKERNSVSGKIVISGRITDVSYWRPLAVSPVFVAKNDPHFGVLKAHVFQAMNRSNLSCRDSASSLLKKT